MKKAILCLIAAIFCHCELPTTPASQKPMSLEGTSWNSVSPDGVVRFAGCDYTVKFIDSSRIRFEAYWFTDEIQSSIIHIASDTTSDTISSVASWKDTLVGQYSLNAETLSVTGTFWKANEWNHVDSFQVNWLFRYDLESNTLQLTASSADSSCWPNILTLISCALSKE
jgi:hypothetical protein